MARGVRVVATLLVLVLAGTPAALAVCAYVCGGGHRAHARDETQPAQASGAHCHETSAPSGPLLAGFGDRHDGCAMPHQAAQLATPAVDPAPATSGPLVVPVPFVYTAASGPIEAGTAASRLLAASPPITSAPLTFVLRI